MTGAVISLIVDGKILRPLTGKSFPFYAREREGGKIFREKLALFFFIRFALFGALLFFIAIWDFHFTAWHFKAFPLSSPVRFDVGSEFFFFFDFPEVVSGCRRTCRLAAQK